MWEPTESKCENQGCKKKGAIYERAGKMMCPSCTKEYDSKKGRQ